MPFELKKNKKKLSLVLKERIDVTEAREMREALKGMPKKDVEVDMGAVSLIDCSILQILSALKRLLCINGARFTITAKSGEAEKAIKLAGLGEAL
jgi:anti-anti-sigma factor